MIMNLDNMVIALKPTMGSHPLFHESDPAPLFESSFDPLFTLKASFGTNTFFDDFCECVIWSVYAPCAMI